MGNRVRYGDSKLFQLYDIKSKFHNSVWNCNNFNNDGKVRKMRRRVYNLEKTPFQGGKDFHDVKNTKEAINLTKELNKKSKKRWVWA